MAIKISSITVGKWKENAYLLEHNNEAWLVDPGDSFELLDSEFELNGKNIRGIINTHGHFDHVGAVQQFKDKYNLSFFLHSGDKKILQQANLYRRLAGENAVFATPKPDEFLDDIPHFELGEKKITVHHTPGHSNGSVCFEIDDCLISGDIIFKESLGRTDLPGGNQQLLTQSVQSLLNRFENFTIYPGHGEPFVLQAPVIEKLKSLL